MNDNTNDKGSYTWALLTITNHSSQVLRSWGKVLFNDRCQNYKVLLETGLSWWTLSKAHPKYQLDLAHLSTPLFSSSRDMHFSLLANYRVLADNPCTPHLQWGRWNHRMDSDTRKIVHFRFKRFIWLRSTWYFNSGYQKKKHQIIFNQCTSTIQA